MSASLRRLAYSGGLVAAAFALKYPLMAIPNVEPLSVVFFSLGFAYGPVWGGFVGLAGEGIYATLNPLGAPIAPVWVAQLASMATVGMIGGGARLVARWFRYDSSKHVRWVVPAAFGVLVTAIFDLATNLAFALAIGPFWPVMIAAVPLALVHMASNALLFAAIFPILRRWLLQPVGTVVTSGHS